MFLNLFGKRRRTHRRKTSSKKAHKGHRKPPSALLKMAKKYRVRVTIKRGSKKVYKSVRLIKMQIKNKKKLLKSRRHRKHRVRRHYGRRSGFGAGEVLQNGQGSGVYRHFFGQQVPANLPPQWNAMGQPDGSYLMVGSPFYAYSK